MFYINKEYFRFIRTMNNIPNPVPPQIWRQSKDNHFKKAGKNLLVKGVMRIKRRTTNF